MYLEKPERLIIWNDGVEIKRTTSLLISGNSKKIFKSKYYELMVHDVRIVGGSLKDVSNLRT